MTNYLRISKKSSTFAPAFGTGSSSARLECLLWEQEVVSSNLAYPTNRLEMRRDAGMQLFFCLWMRKDYLCGVQEESRSRCTAVESVSENRYVQAIRMSRMDTQLVCAAG